MSRFNKIVGLSIMFASAAIITKIFSSKKTSAASDLSNKSSDHNKSKNNSEENELDTRTQKMYKDLSMTKEQKERYEASIRTLKDVWDKNNPNNPMDVKNFLSEEDKSLNAVLDEVQYGMYRDWAKKYAY